MDSKINIGLGLLVTLCFVPGVTGFAVLPHYSILGVVIPVLLFRSKIEITPLHICGLLFLLWAALSLTWAENRLDGIYALYKIVVIALIFCYGSTLADIRPIILGVCLGMAVQALVAGLSVFGVYPVIQNSYDHPAGMMVTPNVLGSALALALAAALVYRVWWFFPIGIAGLVLTHFRAGLLSFAVVGVLWLWQHNRQLAVVIAFGAAAILGSVLMSKGFGSVGDRAVYWRDTVTGLTWLGHGPGSFFGLYPTISDGEIARPSHAYNDFLELTFQFGIGVLPLWLLITLAFEAPHGARLILLAFCEQALVFFPFDLPVSVFIVALTTGYLARVWVVHRYARDGGGFRTESVRGGADVPVLAGDQVTARYARSEAPAVNMDRKDSRGRGPDRQALTIVGQRVARSR